MGKQIVSNYTFNKTSKTVTFTDFGTIRLDRLLLITNVTANTIIYQFNSAALGGSVAGNILTLTYDTSAMNNADKLQIIYDTSSSDPSYDTLQTSLATALAGEDLSNNVLGVIRKPVISSAYTLNANVSFGTSAAVSVKAVPGMLFGVYATNQNAALRYFQVFNKSAAPATNDTPVWSFPIPAGTSTNPGVLQLPNNFFGDNGYYGSNGIAWGISTTRATFTAATAADHDVNVQYL